MRWLPTPHRFRSIHPKPLDLPQRQPRADLDLILSSPVAARKVFVVRMATMALSITGMALLLAAPAINVLVLRGGSHWLGAYGAIVALAIDAAQSVAASGGAAPFAMALPLSSLWILASYWVAQWCIAASLRRPTFP